MTIEERARQHALAAVYGDENDALYKDIETECIKLATEQDRIARAEERERFLRICCETCFVNDHKPCEKPCDRLNRIRRAMEGGSNGNM